MITDIYLFKVDQSNFDQSVIFRLCNDKFKITLKQMQIWKYKL